MDVIEDSLGSRVRGLRTLAGLKAAELAALAGLKSRTHINLIENGTRPTPAGKTLVAIARVLGTSSEWLDGGVGTPPTVEEIHAAIARARAHLAAGQPLAATGTGT